MAEKKPTLEEWRKLYQAAERIKEMAPWEWMMEDEVFGVQSPEDGETGFVSVMGAGGEHFAVAVYPGADALYAFLELEDSAGDPNSEVAPERILEIPQLQAAFEDREMVQKEDREIIKKLNLKFRGANDWPVFRNYAPGMFPWFLNANEARFLTCALEQLLDVAPRIRDDDSILFGDDDDDFLVRTPRKEKSRVVWEDKFVRVPQPPLKTITPAAVDDAQIKKLAQLPRVTNVIEMELTMMPMPVQEKKARPVFPYMLIMVESASSAILAVDLMSPSPSLEAMRAQLPVKVAAQLLKVGHLPGEIAVRTELTADLLTPLAAELEIQINLSPELPGLDDAMESMMQMPMFR